MLKKSAVIFLLAFICQANLLSEELKEEKVENCINAKSWGISLGMEFFGAQGSIKQTESGKVFINCDFTKGGKYIAIYPRFKLPEGIKGVGVKLTANQDFQVNYRIVDSSGRFFQGEPRIFKKLVSNKIMFSYSGRWSSSWGGKKSEIPAPPIQQFYLVILANDKLSKQVSFQLETFFYYK